MFKHICVPDCVHTHACVPGTKLTLFLGPVSWGSCGMNCDMLGSSQGSMDTNVPHPRPTASGVWGRGAGGTETMLMCAWKSRCRDLGCGPMRALAYPHVLV